MKSLRCLVGWHDVRSNGKLTVTCIRCRTDWARGPLPGSGTLFSRPPRDLEASSQAFAAMRDKNSDYVGPDLSRDA